MIAPVDLGQALAFPEAYMQWPAELPAPEHAPRVRRPGRVRRKVATLAAVALAAGLALAGCGVVHQAHHGGAEGCHTPSAPNGTTISVDSAGNATAPFTGGLGFRCANGKWVRMTARHDAIGGGGFRDARV